MGYRTAEETAAWKLRQNGRGIDYAATRLYHSCKFNGKNKVFSLTPELIIQKWGEQEARCYWTGLQLNLSMHGGRHPQRISVDRLDCKGGYTKENVVLSTAFANMGRADVSAEDFREWLSTWHSTSKPETCQLNTTQQ